MACGTNGCRLGQKNGVCYVGQKGSEPFVGLYFRWLLLSERPFLVGFQGCCEQYSAAVDPRTFVPISRFALVPIDRLRLAIA